MWIEKILIDEPYLSCKINVKNININENKSNKIKLEITIKGNIF